MSHAVTPVMEEQLKASVSDGSTISINGRPVRLLNVSDTRARLELGWRVSPSTLIQLKVEPPSGEPIVMKSRVVSARVATVKDGTITYSAEVVFESLTSQGGQTAARSAAQAATPPAVDTPATGTAAAVLAAPADPSSAGTTEDQQQPSPRGSAARDGLDVVPQMRALQDELDASRAELAHERERRQRSEEMLQESERRCVQHTEAREGDRRQWEDDRTALLTQLQAAEARAADVDAALEQERQERMAAHEGNSRQWESERTALLTDLQAAEARAVDAHTALEQERQQLQAAEARATDAHTALEQEHQERMEAHEGDRRQWESERTTLLTDLQAAEARAADAHTALKNERQERTEAHKGDRRQWESERTTLLTDLQAAEARAADAQTTLERERQERTQASSAERTRFEAVIAELVETTNAQQGEYDALLGRLSALEGEAQSLKDHYDAERVARQDAWQQARTDWAAVKRTVETHLEAADALCAASHDASRALRAQGDVLTNLFDMDASTGPSSGAETARASDTDTTN